MKIKIQPGWVEKEIPWLREKSVLLDPYAKGAPQHAGLVIPSTLSFKNLWIVPWGKLY